MPRSNAADGGRSKTPRLVLCFAQITLKSRSNHAQISENQIDSGSFQFTIISLAEKANSYPQSLMREEDIGAKLSELLG
jgi:hypothetical protein